MADVGLAHPRQAQVLAQGSGRFDIEIVERHDAVDDASARQIAHRLDDVRAVPLVVLVGHVKDLVDALQRPFGLALKALRSHQHDAASQAFGLAQKLVAFLVTGEAQNVHLRSPELDSRRSRGNRYRSTSPKRADQARSWWPAPATTLHCRSTPSRHPFSVMASRSSFRSAID